MELYHPSITFKVIHYPGTLLPKGKTAQLRYPFLALLSDLTTQPSPLFHLVNRYRRIRLGDFFKI